MTLKYEGKYAIGEVIRSHDFAPRLGGKQCYIEGVITRCGFVPQEVGSHKAYEITVTKDVFAGKVRTGQNSRVGQRYYVPYEVSFLEFDDRVQLVSQQTGVVGA